MTHKLNMLKICVVAVSLFNMGVTQAQTSSSSSSTNATASTLSTLPAIFPSPVSIEIGKGNFQLGTSITVVFSGTVDQGTKSLLAKILEKRVVKDVKYAKKLPKTIDGNYIVLGMHAAPSILDQVKKITTTVDTSTSGYTLVSKLMDKGAVITLTAKDGDGLYFATQTFRQLAARPNFPEVIINDHPALPIRGTIEGFYGKPWTMVEREKHLEFLSTIKANTFIYSPKDDPYARDRWREPYPASTLNELAKLANIAAENHINFVYAISPGPTICFSDSSDLELLLNKFNALRGVGIHSFYVALDDIEYKEWNCELDSITFGPSGAEAAAVAQAHLLNAVQANIKAVDPTAPPLIMVPTEYYDAKESPYKAALRKYLDSTIVVQWTGTDVVPPAISVSDARAATKAFGRKTFLWDNYPVNDYKESSGRLLLAPYTRREAGLSKELSGIVSNPMNQEVASRIAVTGLVAFAWNDKDYDAEPTWKFAARELAGWDKEATEALLTFFDTQRLAPTFGTHPWQSQAPELKTILDHVADVIANGTKQDREQVLAQLAQTVARFTAAPGTIRNGKVDAAFLAEAKPWLDAMYLWGKALESTTAGLKAANNADVEATRHFEQAAKFAAEATAIQSVPGATRFEGHVLIADGVLDDFIKKAPKLIVF